jgi:hypothetical protein
MHPPEQHHPESLAAEMFSPHLWRRVLHELGYAFWIAGIVAAFIEYNSMREQRGLLKATIRDIGHSVIQGVYKIRHTEEYIKTVVNSCLAIRHVRKNYTVTCDVYEFTPEECKELGIVPGTLVKVVADLKYDSINIGHDYATFEGRYYIARRRGKLDSFAKVTYLKVGDDEFSEQRMHDAEIKRDEPNYSSSDKSYKFQVPAYPGKPVPVHIRSIFVKESSDNEIFAFLAPTLKASIRFFFHMEGLRMGFKSRTASDTPKDQQQPKDQAGTDGHVEWKVDGPLLPNNYVTVWWRSATDDGEPEMESIGVLNAPDSPQRDGVPTTAAPAPGTDPPTESLPLGKKSATGPLRRLFPFFRKRE